VDFDFFFTNFIELTVTGLVLGSVYALVALGYTLVYGVLQLINFAHSEVFMWGSFAVVWAITILGASGPMGLAQAAPYLIVALLAAVAVSGLIAMLVERVAYRRLVERKAPKYIVLISAIGASFVLSEIIGLRDKLVSLIGLRDFLDPFVDRSRDTTVLPIEIQPERVLTIGNYQLRDTEILIIVAALAMMVGLDLFIRRTSFGRQIRAVAQDPEAAALMGANSTNVVRVTFLIGGIMAGVAATLYMIKVGATAFNAGFVLGVKAFAAAVLGGIGNLRGALLGGLLLGIAENYASGIIGSEWRDVTAFVLLILVLLFRPSGLLGESLGRARA
jgi:branched-chain amino acid transport system permease protein